VGDLTHFLCAGDLLHLMRALGNTRMILHAAARVLGCGSVQMLLADEERQALLFTTNITIQELARVAEVETTLGFPLEGAAMPIGIEDSAMIRAFTKGQVCVTTDVADLTGSFIGEEALGAIRQTIGPRSFAAVPICGRTGALGILIFEKPDESGFSIEDRELLLAYADRVGADLESQALSDDVKRLEALEPAKGPPPALYICDGDLLVIAGPCSGRPLSDVLSCARDSLKFGSTAVVRALDGRPLRVTFERAPGEWLLAAVEDLEEAEHLHREAARAQKHLSQIMGSLADAILTLDTEGRVISGNEAVSRILGYTAEELEGQKVTGLCADARGRRRVEGMRLKILSAGFAEGELRLRRKDGVSIPAEVSTLLLAEDGDRPVGVVWRIHDLTERRRVESEQKRLRERLLASERLSALGEMAARIAHEIRNPLVSIGAAAQVVAEELPSQSPVAGEVQAIVREVRRLDGIVTDFLRFARPRSVDRSRADMAEVFDQSVDLVRRKMSGHELKLATEAPLFARCDPDAIKQVLLNVLLNAVEASPGGLIECDARRHDDAVVFSIADRGPGVPGSMRKRVFDPFFSTKTRGTGLGLAISKQIVDEHEGSIRLFARRGGGTRVVIELPVG
jgi:PAS domain S-box-containing protein